MPPDTPEPLLKPTLTIEPAHLAVDGDPAALDVLATAVLLVAPDGLITFANTAAENLLGVARKMLIGTPAAQYVEQRQELERSMQQAHGEEFSDKRQYMTLLRPGQPPLTVRCVVSEPDAHDMTVIEFIEFDAQRKVEREERLLDQTEANRQLVRNLAHEIKNPLGGLRGAAQLLESELATLAQASASGPGQDLREYTQVIIKEADRLQNLVDRMLAPHRVAQMITQINIHEVCERVRSLVLAEHPHGLTVVRDYDTSIPEIKADKSQLIQAMLNIVQNAAQALQPQIAQGTARIVLRTRVQRQVTLAKRRLRLALQLHVIDNGPGIPGHLKERVFLPLVSGRDGGTGLGLTLAQTFIHQHEGLIECDSEPGRTDFQILLPLELLEQGSHSMG